MGRWWTVVDRALDRCGVVGTLRRDALLAVLLAAATAAGLAALLASPLAEPGERDAPLGAVVTACTAQALLLVLRRVRPLTCLALVAAVQVAVVALAPALGVRAAAPVLAAYALGTRRPLATAVRAAALVALAQVLATAALVPTGPGALASALLTTLLTSLAGVAVGGYVATHRRELALLAERASRAEVERRDAVRAAVAGERARMARELHDIAAHHLSGMVVQAAAVERLVERDPAAARAGTAWIRAEGRRTLAEVRLAVGVLREGQDGDDPSAPVPGLAALDDLLRTARGLGTTVELVRTGEVGELPPLADLTAYRVVQESLTNARRHAPGAAVTVVLRAEEEHVLVEVGNAAPARDAGEPAGQGAGLVGMAERARLVGGEFAAGPTPGGGWRVRARVPRRAEVSP